MCLCKCMCVCCTVVYIIVYMWTNMGKWASGCIESPNLGPPTLQTTQHPRVVWFFSTPPLHRQHIINYCFPPQIFITTSKSENDRTILRCLNWRQDLTVTFGRKNLRIFDFTKVFVKTSFIITLFLNFQLRLQSLKTTGQFWYA